MLPIRNRAPLPFYVHYVDKFYSIKYDIRKTMHTSSHNNYQTKRTNQSTCVFKYTEKVPQQKKLSHLVQHVSLPPTTLPDKNVVDL